MRTVHVHDFAEKLCLAVLVTSYFWGHMRTKSFIYFFVLILCNTPASPTFYGGSGGGEGGTRVPTLPTFVGLVLLPVNYSEDSEYIHLL